MFRQFLYFRFIDCYMSVHELQDRENLVHLLAHGSEYAFTQVFDHYRGAVYGTAIKFLKSPQQAEEIVQDIFLKLWVKRAELPAVQNFNGFLFTMARNAILDRLRKTATERTVQKILSAQQTFVNSADKQMEDREYQQLLQQALDNLSTKRSFSPGKD